VTLIEDRVQRSYARTAKVAFWVVAVTVGLLAATVAADKWHPIIALIVGAAIGTAVAFPVAGFIVAWPVIRVIWWWLPEIGIAAGAVYGFVVLAGHTTIFVRLAVVALVVGVPAAIPQVRRHIQRGAWCAISRHRVRSCFNEFIISNRSGSLPLILLAVPTPVGERVWIWLRPGLSLDDLESRLDKIAVACWASTVTVERASDSNSAYVRMDIKRRDALTGVIGSPLVDLVDPNTPAAERTPAEAPSALDLPDVPADIPQADTKRPERKTPARNGATPAPEPVKTASGADVSDWI
jgi:hypothetical protein